MSGWRVYTIEEATPTVHVCDEHGLAIYDALKTPETVRKAKVIAAAPALLETLKTIHNRVHSDICSEECCQDCIEAQREIDRAEGRAS